MEYVQIPSLKQKVSRIGLGTWAIGGWMWGGSKESDSISTIHQALDLGINLIDTAPVYGFGASEEVVGKALKTYGKRDKIIVATKVGLSWEKEKIFRDSRKNTLLKELEASLRRLQLDYIDLYQVHWPDPLTPYEETAETLAGFLKQGKIRAIGVSNYSTEQMKAFQEGGPLHSLQSPYNMFEREIEKTELAYCNENNIAVLGYGAICRGLLSGKIKKETSFLGDDLRKADPKFQEPRFSQYLSCIEKLKEWSNQKYKRSVLALAVRWALDKKIDIALWGARKPDQLKDIEAAFGWKLSSQDFQEIEKILKETVISPIGPEFMAPPERKT